MKKRWKIFWIVCGSMFLIGIICCSVSWGMGTTLTDIAHQFPHGISWGSEDKTYGDPDDDDDDIDEGGPNSQSIIILAECEGKKLLLPGDSTPEELCDALQYYNKINGAPLELDFMKLPHHGSTRNVTKNIFDEVTCSNFIISTKKNEKYYFPNKETIAKLIRYRERADKAINVYFNYQESLDVLGITAEELTENNINLNVCNEFNF